MKFSKQTASVLHLMLAAVLLFGLLLNVASVPAHAAGKQSSSEIMEQIKEMQNQQKENKEEIKKLEAQLKENLTEMEAIVAQKNIIDQEVFLLHKQVTNINNMISAYNVLIADKQEELDASEIEVRIGDRSVGVSCTNAFCYENVCSGRKTCKECNNQSDQ